MADRTVTLEETGAGAGLLDTATNWADDTKAADGDTIVLNAALNAPDGYADGQPLTGALTAVGTFSLSLAGGANLALSDILGALADQVVGNVTVAGASQYEHDDTEAITGNVSLMQASYVNISANTDIGGTVATGNGQFLQAGTGTVTGAVTVGEGGQYLAGASHACTAGITALGTVSVDLGVTLTSDVVLATSGALVVYGTLFGAVSASGACSITLGDAAAIEGTCNMTEHVVAWTVGAGAALAITGTSTLKLGGDAAGLAIYSSAIGGTVTAGANLTAKSLTITDGTYDSNEKVHTLAEGILIEGTCSVTINDAGVDVEVDALAAEVTLDAALACRDLAMKAGTLTAGANDITLSGSMVHTDGTITGTGKLTMAGEGHINITSTGLALEIDTTGQISANGLMSVASFSLASGTYRAFTCAHTIAGDCTQAEQTTLTATGSAWEMTGTGNLNIRCAGIDLTVDADGKTVTATGGLELGSLTLVAGTFSGGTHNVTIYGSLVHTDGTITGTGVYSILDTAAVNLACATAGLVINPGQGKTVTAADTVGVASFGLSSGTYAAGAHAHTINGDCVQTGGLLTGTGSWMLTNTGDLALSSAGLALTIDAVGEEVTAIGPVEVGNFAVTAGTFTGGQQAVTVHGDLIVAGTATGTITLAGTGALTIADPQAALDLVVDADGETVTVGAPLAVNSLAIDACDTYAAGAHAHTLTGSLTRTAGAITGSGLWKLTGDGNLSLTAATIPLEVDAAGKEIVVVEEVTCKSLTITDGDYTAGAWAHTIHGGVVQAGGQITASGEWTMAATGALTITDALPGLAITIDAGAEGTVTTGAPLSCGRLTVASGTYDAAAHAHTLPAGVEQTGGTVTATGTWTLTGTGPLTLASTVVGLDVVVDAPGATITVGHALSIEGLTITDCAVYDAGEHNHTFANDCIHAAGEIIGSGTWMLTGTGSLKLAAPTITVNVDAAASEVALTGALDCLSFIMTDGTLTGGVHNVTVHGDLAHLGGSITGTGIWTVDNTASIEFECATAALVLNAPGKAIGASGAVSVGSLYVADGTNYAAGAQAHRIAGDCLLDGTVTATGTWTLAGTGDTDFAIGTAALVIDAEGEEVTAITPIEAKSLTMTIGTLTTGEQDVIVHGDIVHTAGTITGTGTWTVDNTAAVNIDSDGISLVIVAPGETVTVAGAVTVGSFNLLAGTYAAGAHDHQVAGDFIQGPETVLTGTGTLTMVGTGNLALQSEDIDIVIDNPGEQVTAVGPIECDSFTLTAGAYDDGGFDHIVHGSIVLTAGEFTGTGSWFMDTTGNLDIDSPGINLVVGVAEQTITATDHITLKSLTIAAGTYVAAETHTTSDMAIRTTGDVELVLTDPGIQVRVQAGTCTLGDTLTVASVRIEAGAVLDGDQAAAVLGVGRITGFGTLTNLVPTGDPVHVAPSVIDGGGNHPDKVIWDPWPRAGGLEM